MKKTVVAVFAAFVVLSGVVCAAELTTENGAVLPVVQTEVKTVETAQTEDVKAEEAKADEAKAEDVEVKSEAKAEETAVQEANDTKSEAAGQKTGSVKEVPAAAKTSKNKK